MEYIEGKMLFDYIGAQGLGTLSLASLLVES